MNKHEEIKKQCAQILNYYGVIADEEYNLPNNQRIDVVGYFKNKKEPDIGIEVELTSDLAKDTSKLLGIQTLQLRIIVSDKSDALSLLIIVSWPALKDQTQCLEIQKFFWYFFRLIELSIIFSLFVITDINTA